MKNLFNLGEEMFKQLDLLKVSIESQYAKNLVLEFDTVQTNQGNISNFGYGCTGHDCTNGCKGGCMHACTACCENTPFHLT